MQQMIQLDQMIYNPQTPPQTQQTLIKIREVAADKFRNVLEAFGEPSPERYSDIFLSGVPPTPGAGAPMPGPAGMGAPNPLEGMDMNQLMSGMPGAGAATGGAAPEEPGILG
jgi:PPE-repeat protein